MAKLRGGTYDPRTRITDSEIPEPQAPSLTPAEAELLARTAGIGTSTWSDALDSLGIAGVVQGLSRRSGEGRIAGFAATARHACGELGGFERADFAVGRLIAATAPGRVLVVDMGGANISTFGGLAAMAARRRNATGVIIDGGCRDIEEIRGSGLWLASRWVTPTTGKTRVRLESLGGQVAVGGVTVREGDLVVADDTGIVVVPRADLPRVLEQAERILEVDLAVERDLRAGKSFGEAAAAADYIPER
ncbi:MAG TPA: RraA family protein [Burkholderiales bacterium]|nr:RraA family protein [Burkholderiales bacterium]